jgi:hypothetical protein
MYHFQIVPYSFKTFQYQTNRIKVQILHRQNFKIQLYTIIKVNHY